jgi:maltose O-acetyltransferase
VRLADNVVLNFDTLIDGRKHSVTIGRNVSIGPRATILTLGHDPRSPVFCDMGGDVVIEDYCWIGFGAIILPGVRLGIGSVVAAGAVVCADVADYDIVGGNPAKRIGSRVRGLEYNLQYSPWLL